MFADFPVDVFVTFRQFSIKLIDRSYYNARTCYIISSTSCLRTILNTRSINSTYYSYVLLLEIHFARVLCSSERIHNKLSDSPGQQDNTAVPEGQQAAGRDFPQREVGFGP